MRAGVSLARTYFLLEIINVYWVTFLLRELCRFVHLRGGLWCGKGVILNVFLCAFVMSILLFDAFIMLKIIKK